MYIEAVHNRNSPPAVLLRESYRDGGKIKKRTLLNLTAWPVEQVEGLRIVLKGGTALPPGQDPFTITRSLPHGHVAAILGAIRGAGLEVKTRKIAIFARKYHLVTAAFTIRILTAARRYENRPGVPARLFQSASRAGLVNDGASSAPPKACR